jgi:hypothetical protein
MPKTARKVLPLSIGETLPGGIALRYIGLFEHKE